jgi:hypothetical protein
MWRGYILLLFGSLLATAAWGNGELWLRVEHEARALMEADQAEKALESLLAHEAALTGNTGYDYLLGVLALEQGRLNLAHAALERVVLVNPAHAGAWLDLAIVAYRQNDAITARQLLEYVENNFAPAPVLREQIREVRARLVSHPVHPDAWRVRLEIGRGYDANANNGLQGAGLQLTPQGGGPVWVQYDPSLKPRPDRFWQTRLGVERTVWSDNRSKLALSGDLYAKEHDRLTEFDLLDAGASLRYGYALDTHTFVGVSGQTREIMIDGKSFLRRSVVVATWEKAQGAWEGKLQLEYEGRHYLQTGYADSGTPWLGGWLGWRGFEQALGVSLRQGTETPRTPRAGGETRKTELALVGRQQLAGQWSLNATLFNARYQDENGYNPLLANGARRYIYRQATFIELVRPLAPHWKLGIELHRLRDRSNLAISRQEDTQGLITLSYHTD